MDWKKDREDCLSACREAVDSEQTEQALKVLQTLCHRYGKQRTVSEWEMFFQELHEIYEANFYFKQEDNFQSGAQKALQHQLQKAFAEVLPAIMPFELQIIFFDQLSQLEEKAKTLLPDKVHYVLYWCDTDNIHLRYLNAKGQRLDTDERSLLSFSNRSDLTKNQLVDNLLALITLQDQLKLYHQRLSPDLMRALFAILIDKKYLVQTEKPNTDKQRRIICQSRDEKNIYYAEWFRPLDEKETVSLPGQWAEAFPTYILKPATINRSEGWIQLDLIYHTELVALLEQQERQYKQFYRYQRACSLYQTFSKYINGSSLPADMIGVWYFTTAKIAANSECWYPPVNLTDQLPYAIDYASKALVYLTYKTEAYHSCLSFLDKWITKALSKAIQPLLPIAQKKFADALLLWQKKVGELSIDEFEMTLSALQNLVERFLWISPESIQQGYANFNQACSERKSDLLTQIKTLEFEKKSSTDQNEKCKRWQSAWHTLFSRWEEHGYHYEIENWKKAIDRTLKSPEKENVLEASIIVAPKPWLEVKSSEDTALSLFEVKFLITNKDSKSIIEPPHQWEKAHLQWKNFLTIYALHGQKFIFNRAKNRYKAKLYAYQLLCEELNSIHSKFSTTAEWCQNRLAEFNSISSTLLAKTQILPRQWQWQRFRTQIEDKENTPLLSALFENLIDYIQNLLGEPPSPFEAIGIAVNSSTPHWRIHILSNQPDHVYFSVFLSVFSVFYSLLQPLAAPLQFSCDTPLRLASLYCPLLLEITEIKLLENRDLNYLLIFHYRTPEKPKIEDSLSHFILHLIRRLQQISSEGKGQEKRIREHYHAQQDQPLIRLPDFSDPVAMLKLRQKAHKEIRELWHYLSENYKPLVELMVYLLVDKSDIVKICLQELHAENLQDLYLVLYRHISRIWKPHYFKKLSDLWKTSTAEQQACLQQIREDPDESGWRYRQVEEHENWSRSLQTLVMEDEKDAEKKSTILHMSYIENGQLQKKQLLPEVAAQLLDPKNPKQWRQKAKHIGGRHHVLRVESQKMGFWFKFYPEEPGIEELVKKIHERTGTFGTAAQQLVKLNVNAGSAIPVLISQEVSSPVLNPKEDNNLAKILLHRPEQVRLLSPLSFVSNLVIVTILNPEDDKSNSYFFLPDGKFFLLKHIDNDRAFFHATHEGWFSELNVKTIIFCLDFMTQSWKELEKIDFRLQQYRQQIQRIVPSEFLQDLMREASDLHDYWCWLFTEEEAVVIAQQALQKGEISLPLMMIVPDCETALLERFFLIQKALNDPELNGFDLLDRVQPNLSKLYRNFFKLGTTPRARFEAGPGKLYRRHKGEYQTSLSGTVSLSRQLNLSEILKLNHDSRRHTLMEELIKKIWRRQDYSAAQALYKLVSWLEKNKLGIKEGLLGDEKKGSVAQFQFKSLPLTERTDMLKQLSEKLPKITPLISRRKAARNILTALAQAPVGSLLLSSFHEVLTDDLLIPILKCAGRQLYLLDISNCLLVTNRIITVLEIYCKNIRTFRARRLNWKEMTVSNLSQLKRLDFSYAVYLNWLNLYGMHRLQHLRLNNCSQLAVVGYKQFSLWGNLFIETLLPKLSKLNIAQCKSLIELKIVSGQLDWKNSSFEGCNSVGLINWFKLLYSKQVLTPSELLKQISIAVSKQEKTLDLSSTQINKEDFEWLCRIISCNLFFNQMILTQSKILTKTEKNSYTFNTIFLGADGVGKTTLINRFEGFYLGPTVSTTGIDFRTKRIQVDNHTCKLDIWDSPGQIRYREGIYPYLRRINLFIICFSAQDINFLHDLDDVKLWISLIAEYADINIPKVLILVRTKSEDHESEFDSKYKTYAEQNNMLYFSCSGTTGKGVHEIFISACKTLIGLRESKSLLRAPELKSLIHTPEISSKNHYEAKHFIAALQNNHLLTGIEAEFLSQEEKEEIDKLMQRNKHIATYGKEPESKIIISPVETELTDSISHLDIDDLKSPFSESSSISEMSSSVIEKSKHEEKKSDLYLHENKREESIIAVKSEVDFFANWILPFTKMQEFDAKSLQKAVSSWPEVSTINSIAPWQEQLYQYKDRLMDKTVSEEIVEILKFLCLIGQYQQKSMISAEDSSEIAYIRSKPALLQYHDLLLQTLEFSIKAAILDMTGSFKTTDSVDTFLSGVGGILNAIPGVGGLVKIPVAALTFSNQLKINRQHWRISQLFSGGRDVEEKVALLALRITISISEELLENKKTVARREALEKKGVENYYIRAKTFLKQQKIEWLNWQLLTPAQKLALWDADYLLNKLPDLSSQYLRKKEWVDVCLALLMRKPNFLWDEEKAATKFLTHVTPQEQTATKYRQKKYKHHLEQREIWTIKLKSAVQKMETLQALENLLPCLRELEVILWELYLLEDETETTEKNLLMLTNWFDRLISKNSSKSTTTSTIHSSSSEPKFIEEQESKELIKLKKSLGEKIAKLHNVNNYGFKVNCLPKNGQIIIEFTSNLEDEVTVGKEKVKEDLSELNNDLQACIKELKIDKYRAKPSLKEFKVTLISESPAVIDQIARLLQEIGLSVKAKPQTIPPDCFFYHKPEDTIPTDSENLNLIGCLLQ